MADDSPLHPLLVDPAIWTGKAEHILGMVCGYRPERAASVGLMMLQAYFDESVSDGVMILAGYVAPAINWGRFSNEWQEALTMRPRWDYLHMTEVGFPYDDEKKLKLQTLYRIIEKHVSASVACAVHIGALESAVKKHGLPPFVANPYFLAFRDIVAVTIANAKLIGLEGPIDFIFDEKSESERILPVWPDFTATMPPEYAKFIQQRPDFRDDELVVPLQAADKYAWWVRRWFLEDGQIHGNQLKYPWRPKVNFPRLVAECRPQYIETEIGKIALQAKESGIWPEAKNRPAQ